MPGETTKTLEAYRQIKKGVLSGRFKPGDRLVESKVCEDLGLGRAAVREALLLLHGEGVIKKQGAYRGHVVEFTEDIPPEEMLFRYEFRELVAGGASRFAAKSMNGWQIDNLRLMAEHEREAEVMADRNAKYRANAEFHDFLLENCGNPLLLHAWESYHLAPPQPRSDELENEIMAQVADSDNPTLVDVVNAIAAHDQDTAESLMKQRVRKIAEALRTVVQRRARKRNRGAGTKLKAIVAQLT